MQQKGETKNFYNTMYYLTKILTFLSSSFKHDSIRSDFWKYLRIHILLKRAHLHRLFKTLLHKNSLLVCKYQR